MIESLSNSFSISRPSTRLGSSRLRSRHISKHILVQKRSLVLLGGGVSLVVVSGTRPVTTTLVVRVSMEVLVP